MGAVPLVRVIRSGVEESVHRGDVAVADADGGLLASAGEPDRLVFARSSMKPLQAAVSLSFARLDLPDRELAVMCGSHNGEPVHVEAVRALLSRAGVPEAALQCPPDRPLDLEAAAEVGKAAPVHHNCSGKHAGMLAASLAQGWPLESYRERDHPLQEEITHAVEGGAGMEPLHIGVDGCGVPVYAVPLRAMARLFARLASPDRWEGLGPWVRRAVGAMRAEPYLVAGKNRLDTSLPQAAPNIVAKGGAEGLLCAALLDRAVGVAVKIRDGAHRAAAPALLHALRSLDALDDRQLVELARFSRPPVLGGGVPVGELEAAFALTRP